MLGIDLVATQGGIATGDLVLLSEARMRRIESYFPLSHGIPRVDDRRIVSGIIFVIRNGLRWCDAPAGYGPHKTIYNRFFRCRRPGVFNRIFEALRPSAFEHRRARLRESVRATSSSRSRGI